MKKPTSTKITHGGIIATMRDMIDIFSASQERLRQELALFRSEMYGFRDEMYGFRDEMYDFKNKMTNAHEELKDEFRTFKYEMRDFRDETNATLKQHDVYFENIQQDIIIFGGLEARVSRLEKVHP